MFLVAVQHINTKCSWFLVSCIFRLTTKTAKEGIAIDFPLTKTMKWGGKGAEFFRVPYFLFCSHQCKNDHQMVWVEKGPLKLIQSNPLVGAEHLPTDEAAQSNLTLNICRGGTSAITLGNIFSASPN